jgi:hypothetical protein
MCCGDVYPPYISRYETADQQGKKRFMNMKRKNANLLQATTLEAQERRYATQCTDKTIIKKND